MHLKLTVHFKHEMIGMWQRFDRNFEFKWNFELTVFGLTVPDMYQVFAENKGIICYLFLFKLFHEII